MTKFGTLVTLAALAPASTSAFAPVASNAHLSNVKTPALTHLYAEEDPASEAVFVASDAAEVDADATFAKVESLGKGSAKVRQTVICDEHPVKFSPLTEIASNSGKTWKKKGRC